ncbi:unnamed protein product [Linum tenue]|uniref:Uncharacterized protein n=1 Tax=Linum tenue TaxID=586396 RepID=A0AAV0RSJ5_9ROSI|nr:unnamed protein product [Linum tenue]
MQLRGEGPVETAAILAQTRLRRLILADESEEEWEAGSKSVAGGSRPNSLPIQELKSTRPQAQKMIVAEEASSGLAAGERGNAAWLIKTEYVAPLRTSHHLRKLGAHSDHTMEEGAQVGLQEVELADSDLSPQEGILDSDGDSSPAAEEAFEIRRRSPLPNPQRAQPIKSGRVGKIVAAFEGEVVAEPAGGDAPDHRASGRRPKIFPPPPVSISNPKTSTCCYSHLQVSAMSSSSDDFYTFGPYKIHSKEVFYSTDLSYAMVNLRPLLPGSSPINLH